MDKKIKAIIKKQGEAVKETKALLKADKKQDKKVEKVEKLEKVAKKIKKK
jgi:hypothetical protein